MLTLFEILPYFENKKIRVAEAFEISKQAVGKWPDGVLPKERERQIRNEILPEIFGSTHSAPVNHDTNNQNAA